MKALQATLRDSSSCFLESTCGGGSGGGGEGGGREEDREGEGESFE